MNFDTCSNYHGFRPIIYVGIDNNIPNITLDKEEINLEITSGSTATETLTATTENISGDLIWESSDTSVAELSGSGNTRTITVKKSGSATITVSYGDVSATCTVNVTELIPKITLDKNTINLEIANGSTATETLTATTENISGDLIWESSDTSVAEISGSGNTRTITVKKSGSATITVSYGDVSATCTVNVTEKTANLITFYISGVEYQAEEGMTWAEWCDSSYNTDQQWTIGVEGSVKRADNAMYVQSGGAVLSGTQLIEEEWFYDANFLEPPD